MGHFDWLMWQAASSQFKSQNQTRSEAGASARGAGLNAVPAQRPDLSGLGPGLRRGGKLLLDLCRDAARLRPGPPRFSPNLGPLCLSLLIGLDIS